eukprot:2931736-Rhodomonas_salina.1
MEDVTAVINETRQRLEEHMQQSLLRRVQIELSRTLAHIIGDYAVPVPVIPQPGGLEAQPTVDLTASVVVGPATLDDGASQDQSDQGWQDVPDEATTVPLAETLAETLAEAKVDSPRAESEQSQRDSVKEDPASPRSEQEVEEVTVEPAKEVVSQAAAEARLVDAEDQRVAADASKSLTAQPQPEAASKPSSDSDSDFSSVRTDDD